MWLRLYAFAVLICASQISPAMADDPPFPGTRSAWHGFDRYDFEVDSRPVVVVAPKTAATGKPWVWHGEFFGHKTEPDIALLQQGFHIVSMRVPDMLGSPGAVKHWNRFYEELTGRYHFNARASLVGLSRGGLYCYNWAIANPTRVACIYGDAPVCDFRSWPGGFGKGKRSDPDWQLVLQEYGFASDDEARAYSGNPVDSLAPLAAADVPILHVYGDADDVVPWDENTGVVAERYRALGGRITLIPKPGIGHHPHGLADATPIVQFILAANRLETEVPIRHAFFIAGPSFTGIIAEDGSEQWNAGRAAARDGFVLSNGNALIAWADEVKELTPDHETAFQYTRADLNQEIGTVQRLANGNTLITELGARPRLLEVAADGSIVVDVPLQPETDNAHMQTRMARKLDDGNYLVPHLLAFRVREYSPDGHIVREIATDLDELGGRAAENWPFTAIVIPNGNVLVNLTHGNKTVEFDPHGAVVWQVSNDDFDGKPFVDPCGAQRLPNGNTVIASYGAQQGIKVFEVTRDRRIVWTYEGPHRAHEIQILTTNGIPLEGAPLK